MANTLWHQKGSAAPAPADRHAKSWSRKMSDHIAFGLLVYTGLNIFVTMEAIKGTSGSILPFFGLVLLVAAIIPACIKLEHRWQRLETGHQSDRDLRGAYQRDMLLVWLGAVGLPFAVTGLYKLLAGTI